MESSIKTGPQTSIPLPTLTTSPDIGLSSEEARARLVADGPNEVTSVRRRGKLSILAETAREPMFLLLVGASALYGVVGDIKEALMLLGFVLVIIGITVYQEGKTERALEALRDLSSPRALVVRDGRRIRIAGREVVRGDIVVLSEGDRVPADGILLSSHDLLVDESLLTGESVPVRKTAADPEVFSEDQVARPGGDDQPFVFSGTLVVRGQGLMVVSTTGPRTQMGSIGRVLAELKPEPSTVQKQSRVLVRRLAIAGGLLCGLVVVINGLAYAQWVRGLLSGITLAMAIIPEEIPVVLTVFLALGAWRMGQRGVLTRRIPALETLGSTTTLCVDKTGTLTENRMRIAALFAQDRWLFLDPKVRAFPTLAQPEQEPFHNLIEFGILASEKDPFDPMEKAFVELGDLYLRDSDHLHADWELVHEYALTPDLLAMSHVWRSPRRDAYIIAAKGAPEAIADLCHLSPEAQDTLRAAVERMAEEGLRVLAVAKAHYRGPEWPGLQHHFDFELVGLVGLADPPRASVVPALAECRSAGIRVVMITGDYPKTAQAIASQIGLEPRDQVITGSDMDLWQDQELQDRVGACSIFARVTPQHKLRLVRAFKARGEIVAMTGDGVNDAPALKAADVGVAMGQRGTDVAREAASIVVLDDDFASIVASIRMGRRIYDNLKKAVAYIFAVHMPVVGLALVPLALHWPLVLLPVHVVFLELIIDPACSVAFEAEPEEKDVMQRPPRNPKEPLFGHRVIGIAMIQGLVVLAAALAVCGLALGLGRSAAEARALTLACVVMANLGLILTNRSWSGPIVATLRIRNPALWWVVAGATVVLAAILCIAPLRSLFSLAAPRPAEVLLSALAGFGSVLWFEIYKISRRARRHASPRGSTLG